MDTLLSFWTFPCCATCDSLGSGTVSIKGCNPVSCALGGFPPLFIREWARAPSLLFLADMTPTLGRTVLNPHQPGEFRLYADVVFVTYSRSRVNDKNEFHETLFDSLERSLAQDRATSNVSVKLFGSKELHDSGIPHYHVAIQFSQKIYWPNARQMLSVWIIVNGRREIDTRSIFIKTQKPEDTAMKFLRNVQDYIAKDGDVFGHRIPDKELTRRGRRKRLPQS